MSGCKLILPSLLLLSLVALSAGQIGAIKNFIQSNIVGLPTIHKSVPWNFDPEISKKRSIYWQEIHGVKGEKLIERLGLGIDGEEHARLQRQRARDRGHLGGLNYFLP